MMGAYAAGATASLLARRSASVTRALGHFGLCVGALAGVALAIRCTAGGSSGAPLRVELPSLFPFAHLSLILDGLGAFFLLVVSIVAVASAVYGPAYLRAHATGSPAVEVLGINLFVGSMALVLCAGDALTFLLAWEGMTLASYTLVVGYGAWAFEETR
jgi:hydrogenase-4 component B